MKTLQAKLDASDGVIRASDLTRYERRIMRRISASYYINRHGVLTVLDMKGGKA